MLTYDITNIDIPIYEYLYKCIKSDIQSGKLSRGEKLPSKRTLAKNLGISTITVENAYDQLISEGYIYTLPKRGYYISDMAELTHLASTSRAKLDIKYPDAHPSGYNLSSTKTSSETFPFSTWAHIMREIIVSKENEVLKNSTCGGVYELREAISEHLASFRGMSVDPDQIIIGAGTEYLYGLLIQLLGHDRIYCLENPGYQKVSYVCQSNNVRYVYADIDNHGIIVNDIEASGADVVHTSPTHHFPTGVTMPVSRRYELLNWANSREGRYIIEDDYDSEFRLNGKPLPPLQTLDAGERVIYMNTFSKSLASTIRISYMVLPRHLANDYYKRLSFYTCTVSNFEQYTLAQFIRQGYLEKHINRTRLYYGRIRSYIMKKLEEILPKDKYLIHENESGLHFLLELNTELSDREVCTRLADQGVLIRAISSFYASPQTIDRHQFLLIYSDIDTDGLAESLQIIKRSVL